MNSEIEVVGIPLLYQRIKIFIILGSWLCLFFYLLLLVKIFWNESVFPFKNILRAWRARSIDEEQGRTTTCNKLVGKDSDDRKCWQIQTVISTENSKEIKGKTDPRKKNRWQTESIDKEYSLIKAMKNRTQRREGVLEKRRHCY